MVSAISNAIRHREKAKKKAYNFTSSVRKSTQKTSLSRGGLRATKPKQYKSHLLHLEDLIWNHKNIILLFFKNIINNETDISIKWDGAPAIVFGYEGRQFFVATKSIFNKEPKYYKSVHHIRNSASLSDNVKDKLAESYEQLSRLNFAEGIYQGDLLFGKSDVTKMLIGENEDIDCYHTFQPNTILYAAEPKTETDYHISTADYGIAIHTEHTGSIGNLKQKYNISFPYFADSIWIPDTHISLPNTENINFNNIINSIETINIKFEPDLIERIISWNNKTIWNDNEFDTPENHTYGLLDSLTHLSHINQVRDNFNLIEKMYKIYFDIKLLKKELINSLNDQFNLDIRMFYLGGGEPEPADPEGYVARIDNTAVKLVNRSNFSYKNQSDKFTKGWQR